MIVAACLASTASRRRSQKNELRATPSSLPHRSLSHQSELPWHQVIVNCTTSQAELIRRWLLRLLVLFFWLLLVPYYAKQRLGQHQSNGALAPGSY